MDTRCWSLPFFKYLRTEIQVLYMAANCKIFILRSLVSVRRVYIVTLLDHEAVNVCFLNERLIAQ